MILKELSLTNYKNIESAHLQFSPKLNCIIGSNGMGKTNLLDSIYFLSFARSYVYLPDNMLIRQGADIAIIEGTYEIDDTTEKLLCGLRRGKAKTFRRNKKEYKKISAHIGTFPLVMTSPADFDLITGGSEERRKFMDTIISQHSAPYLTALIYYKKLLEQRNTLLKQFSIDLKTLLVLEEQMAIYAYKIIQHRCLWLKETAPLFLNYYHYISNNQDDVALGYIGSFETPLEEITADSIKAEWIASRDKDKALGYTSKGPHRDDLEMLLNAALIRKTGSQGQNKTFLIALKFAQFKMLSDLYPRLSPILLLDDVFDKLDSHRVDRIVQLVASNDEFGQIFMTDTNRKYLDQILSQLPPSSYSIFQANRGEFTQI